MYMNTTKVYKFKKIMRRTDQFRKIINRHKRIGYDLNVMRQSAYLVINPITVGSFAALFSCTPVDRLCFFIVLKRDLFVKRDDILSS